MKNRGRIFFRILMIVVISLVIGLSIYSWNARRVVGNSLPMPFGIGSSVVLSGSMEPTLRINDLVFVKAAESYEVGDVVVYQGSLLVIHRIVSIDGTRVVTKGDNNNTADDPIELSQIKGKLVGRIPLVGLLIRGLKTLPGILVVLALAVWLMHRSWQGEKKADDERLEALKEEIRKLKEEEEAKAADASPEAEEPAAPREPEAPEFMTRK